MVRLIQWKPTGMSLTPLRWLMNTYGVDGVGRATGAVAEPCAEPDLDGLGEQDAALVTVASEIG